MLSKLKGGHTAGTKTEERLLAVEVLEKDDASKKDELYAAIAKKGVETRKSQNPPNGHKFNSNGFTEELARSLDMDPQAVRKLIRSMRADMVYAQRHEPDEAFAQKFKYIAEDYIDAYAKRAGTNSSEKRQQMEEVRNQWPGDVEGFYKVMYEKMGSKAMGTWTPYEMEALSEFYATRKSAGSKLTRFDRLILESRNQRRGTRVLTTEIRGSTGIPIDNGNIDLHRNVLLYSKPSK